MNSEEAKALYSRAEGCHGARDYGEALSLLDELDAARPNSKHVLYYRARCMAALGQVEEAIACGQRLEGKLEAEQIQELKAEIDAARTAQGPPPAADPASDSIASSTASTDGSTGNVFLVESAYPVSIEEVTVTGSVKSGVFHTGDSVSLVSPSGMPLLAPILRIGTAETPVKLARAGQKTVLLLGVEPDHVGPGSRITSTAKEESYAKTMVVSTEPSPSARQDSTPALIEAEKLLKQRKYDETLAMLEDILTTDPDSRMAHWLLARVRLEADGAAADNQSALKHIRRAYELGGSEDPGVIDTLANALAANGEARQGLRFLERLLGGDIAPEARMALTQRIYDFRDQYTLGHVWEFADTYGDVIFESGDVNEIVTAIKNGTLNQESKCRRDRIGEWRGIEAALAPDHPEVAAQFQPAPSTSNMMYYVAAALLAAAAIAVVLVFL